MTGTNPTRGRPAASGTSTLRLFVVLLAVFGMPLSAQTRTLHLVVIDSLGTPIREAEARVNNQFARTDSLGRASLVEVDQTASVTVRKLGYAPRSIDLAGVTAADPLRVVLVELLVEVDGMVISALRHPFVEGFDRRRRQGIGAFITPRQVEERRASVSSDLFRQLPMVQLVRLPGGGTGLRFPTILSIRRSSEDCVPMLWLDGQRAPGLEIDEIRAGDILAIEIYRGASTVPADFATGGRTQCGAIVIWTKRYLGRRK